jgi:hypothetical protein
MSRKRTLALQQIPANSRLALHLQQPRQLAQHLALAALNALRLAVFLPCAVLGPVDCFHGFYW